MFRAKICGITNWADARLAVDLGADALGFNFYCRSPRFIPVPEARRIIARLPRGVAAVGVFVDDYTDDMREIGKIVSSRSFNCMVESRLERCKHWPLSFP